jgi:hypothetical protein
VSNFAVPSVDSSYYEFHFCTSTGKTGMLVLSNEFFNPLKPSGNYMYHLL